MKDNYIHHQASLIADALIRNDTADLGGALNAITVAMQNGGHISADVAVFLNAAAVALIQSANGKFDPIDAVIFILHHISRPHEPDEVNPCTPDQT